MKRYNRLVIGVAGILRPMVEQQMDPLVTLEHYSFNSKNGGELLGELGGVLRSELVLALGVDVVEAQRAERLALADQQQRVRELSPIEMPALPAVLGRRSETDVTVAAQAGDRDVLEALGRYRADVTRRESENAGRLRRCLWLLGVFRSDGSDYADRLEQWIRGRFRVPAGIELPTDPVGRRQCAGPLTRDYAILPRAWRQL